MKRKNLTEKAARLGCYFSRLQGRGRNTKQASHQKPNARTSVFGFCRKCSHNDLSLGDHFRVAACLRGARTRNAHREKCTPTAQKGRIGDQVKTAKTRRARPRVEKRDKGGAPLFNDAAIDHLHINRVMVREHYNHATFMSNAANFLPFSLVGLATGREDCAVCPQRRKTLPDCYCVGYKVKYETLRKSAPKAECAFMRVRLLPKMFAQRFIFGRSFSGSADFLDVRTKTKSVR